MLKPHIKKTYHMHKHTNLGEIRQTHIYTHVYQIKA